MVTLRTEAIYADFPRPTLREKFDSREFEQ